MTDDTSKRIHVEYSRTRQSHLIGDDLWVDSPLLPDDGMRYTIDTERLSRVLLKIDWGLYD